ncbi:MAG: hypothetical protein H7831_09610 [Magnetococcus sp. WYHC-3]
MATRDHYSSDELARIRATLKEQLGDNSGTALKNLEERFVPSEKTRPPEELVDERGDAVGWAGGEVNVDEVISDGQLDKMIRALPVFKDAAADQGKLVAAIMKHPEVKSFHLVEALSKVSKDPSLVDALVQRIVSNKGVNPLIDACRFAAVSPASMRALAQGIAEEGTVNHIMRAIASAPRDQPDAEIIWTMEVIGKGGLDQITECIKLIDPASPGAVVLATGLANRKEVKMEILVRSLSVLKDSPKAATVLAVRLAGMVEDNALASLLEKHVSDKTEAGEVLVAKLVHGGRVKELSRVTRFMRADSVASRMLAVGIMRHNDADLLLTAYERFSAAPIAQAMVGTEFVKKKGTFGALKAMGKKALEFGKLATEVANGTKEGRERLEFHWKKTLGLGDPPPVEKAEKAEKTDKKDAKS